MRLRTARSSRAAVMRRAAGLCIVGGLILLAACGLERRDPRYAAEKRLFKAKKAKEDLLAGGMKPEFVAKTIDNYRGIVRDFEGGIDRNKELEKTVVSAQMDLAELEFHAGLLSQSRGDFETAYGLAAHVPAARANALYSAGYLSEELDEPDSARALYERFFVTFLNADSVASTARMNTRYLITPLKLADITLRSGDGQRSRRWLGEAEKLYGNMIAHETDGALLKEARMDLLATYLQEKEWAKGLAFAKELEKSYREAPDLSSIVYIEAKITQDGLADGDKAISLYRSIADRWPQGREAPDALLAAAGIQGKAGRLEEAAKLYERVIGAYGDRVAETVEAHWRLAEIEERKGDAEAASLRYRSIYTKYPETLQGFEAPLRIAKNYEDKGQKDAAQAAYHDAFTHYEGLVSGERALSTRLMAEQYLVRTLVEEKRWSEAIDRLLKLPDRYPDYAPFRRNYFRAASIYEKELGSTENAARILKECAARYPGTELARDAEKELTRLTR